MSLKQSLVICPVCNKGFGSYLIEQHASECAESSSLRSSGNRNRENGGNETARSPTSSMVMNNNGWLRASGPRPMSLLSPEQRKMEEEKELVRLTIIAEEDRKERDKKEMYQIFISTRYNVSFFPSNLLLRIFSYLGIVEQIRLTRVSKQFRTICYPLLDSSKETVEFLKARVLSKRDASKGQIPNSTTTTTIITKPTQTNSPPLSKKEEEKKKKVEKIRLKEEQMRQKEEQKLLKKKQKGRKEDGKGKRESYKRIKGDQEEPLWCC